MIINSIRYGMAPLPRKNPSPRHIMNNYGSYNNMYFTNNADFIFFDSISTAPGVIVTL